MRTQTCTAIAILQYVFAALVADVVTILVIIVLLELFVIASVFNLFTCGQLFWQIHAARARAAFLLRPACVEGDVIWATTHDSGVQQVLREGLYIYPQVLPTNLGAISMFNDWGASRAVLELVQMQERYLDKNVRL